MSYFSRQFFNAGYFAPNYWGGATASSGGDGAKDMEYLVRYHADVQRRLAKQRQLRDEEAVLLVLSGILDDEDY